MEDVQFDSIPQELRERLQWVVWKLEAREAGGKITKVPYNAGTGRRADSTKPATWRSFEDARDAYLKEPRRYDGIGFVFSADDPYVGIDLDDCRNEETGEPTAWAAEWLRAFDTYSEVSPSGGGFKLWTRGKQPGERHKASGFGIDKAGAVEIYDQDRFFTVTGERVPWLKATIEPRQSEVDALYAEVFPPKERAKPAMAPAPAQVPLDDEELLRKARKSARFDALWRGSLDEYGGDWSRADLALCGSLAWWTAGDIPRMDRLFRSSGLFREKWDERRGAVTYGQRTLAKAVEGRTEFYSPAMQWDASGKGRKEQGQIQSMGKSNSSGPNQATKLVEAALAAGMQLFRTPDDDAYAVVSNGGRRETLKITTKTFRIWLQNLGYEEGESVPGGQAVQDATNTLAARAMASGRVEDVYTRLAECGDAIYLNLANQERQLVRITADGWEVTDECPLRFRITKGMMPLPNPSRDGSIERLRPLVNADQDSWVLVVAWLMCALRPRGPYPVLLLSGEQGSAKSTLARLLRQLIDPSRANLRAIPKDERDMLIAAKNGWVIAFDNVSMLFPSQSDALCRLATGGGLSTRELYTDDGETLFSASRPVLLNGIGAVSQRSDLLDRAFLLCLKPIPDSERKSERELDAAFEAVAAEVLGGLLDGVVSAMRRMPDTKLDGRPRMADAAEWVTAAEAGLGWESGTFLNVYLGNRREADRVALEGSPIAEFVIQLVPPGLVERWEGSAGDLLDALKRCCPSWDQRAEWPKNPRALSVQLDRIAPNLRACGIERVQGARTGTKRVLRLVRAAVPSDANQPNDDANGCGRDANPGSADAGDDCDDASDEDDTSSGVLTSAYIPRLEEGVGGADDRVATGEDRAPEFASFAGFPSLGVRGEACRFAKALGFQWIEIRPATSVGPGEAAWERFTRKARIDLVEEAARVLGMLINAEESRV